MVCISSLFLSWLLHKNIKGKMRIKWNKIRYVFSVNISTCLPLSSVYNRLMSNPNSSPCNITHAREFQTWKNHAQGYIFWWAWPEMKNKCEKYWISNIKRNLVLKYNIKIYCGGINNNLDLLLRQNVLVLESWCLTPHSYIIYM